MKYRFISAPRARPGLVVSDSLTLLNPFPRPTFSLFRTKITKTLFLLLLLLLSPAAIYEFRTPESLEIGAVVGAIRAMDADIGENAEMDYRIIGSDGPGMFDITTNRSTQEGVIVLRKVSDCLLALCEGSYGAV